MLSSLSSEEFVRRKCWIKGGQVGSRFDGFRHKLQIPWQCVSVFHHEIPIISISAPLPLLSGSIHFGALFRILMRESAVLIECLCYCCQNALLRALCGIVSSPFRFVSSRSDPVHYYYYYFYFMFGVSYKFIRTGLYGVRI